MDLSISFPDPVFLPNISSQVPLAILNSLANAKSGNSGKDNFEFYYNEDKIPFDDLSKKLVDVIGENEDGCRTYEIQCFECGASWTPWRNEIILKNSTKQKLKVEVKYPGVDFDQEQESKYGLLFIHVSA